MGSVVDDPTARRLCRALAEAFPGAALTLRPGAYGTLLCWRDGPAELAVHAALAARPDGWAVRPWRVFTGTGFAAGALAGLSQDAEAGAAALRSQDEFALWLPDALSARDLRGPDPALAGPARLLAAAAGLGAEVDAHWPHPSWAVHRVLAAAGGPDRWLTAATAALIP